MERIARLDPALVSKIAAGEVIERPASVVKELLENAIDAGARQIDVELEEGGVALIRVRDDGRGIVRDDLPLAVAPHATSKIATVDDLFCICTLGFRGEALASMASVAQLRIVSRPRDSDSAYELSASDEGVAAPQPCAAPPGTTVELRNLFYNVPARRKFLRQAGTELSHVTEQIARLALAHPHIGFRQSNGQRVMRMLPAVGGASERIVDFYGAELANELFPVARKERGLSISGLIAPPASARATARWQYVFLNGRFIADKHIRYAIREAYRGLIEPSRNPVVFLFLTADPGDFDVNVHPTKVEVRWRDAGLVQSQVLAVLRETLLSRDLTPVMRTPVRGGFAADSERGARQAIADYLREARPQADRWAEAPHAPAMPMARDEASRPITPDSTESSRDDLAGDAASPRRALQVHNTYLVVEAPDGLMIVDQHALHERILYEQFCERILAGPLESQRLLLPETLAVSPAQRAAVEQHADLLARLGVELALFGPDSVAVQAFPTMLQRVDPREFVRDALDRLAEPGHVESPETLVHALLDMMACKAAVKAGDSLGPEEIQSLLAHKGAVQRSSNCPHGRPTTLSLSIQDLERQFKRT